MRNRARFNRFEKPTFVCDVCGRRTRNTGQDVDHLCAEDYELAGMDNSVNDGGRAPTPEETAEGEALLKRIAKLGGDAQKSRDSNDYLFPVAKVLEPEKPKQSRDERRAQKAWDKVERRLRKELKKHGLTATDQQIQVVTEGIIEGGDKKQWREGATIVFLNLLAMDDD